MLVSSRLLLMYYKNWSCVPKSQSIIIWGKSQGEEAQSANRMKQSRVDVLDDEKSSRDAK